MKKCDMIRYFRLNPVVLLSDLKSIHFKQIFEYFNVEHDTIIMAINHTCSHVAIIDAAAIYDDFRSASAFALVTAASQLLLHTLP